MEEKKTIRSKQLYIKADKVITHWKGVGFKE